MNKYLVIIYLSIMAAFLVIIQIGIRHPMNPADMAGTWLTTALKRIRKLARARKVAFTLKALRELTELGFD